MPFLLVLASAVLHASWNFVAKQTQGGMAFAWLFSGLAALLYTPIALYLYFSQRPALNGTTLLAFAGVSAIHTAYYFLLLNGYRVGDLSVVYPLARGTGPLLATFGAVLLFNERPHPLLLVGIALVTLGVFVIAGNPFQHHNAKTRAGVVYGLLVGLSIATYTLWDKWAVADLLLPPLLLTWVSNLTRTIILTPYALRHWQTIQRHWQQDRRAAVSIAVLDSLSYGLFLLALQLTATNPISSLSPLRQLSILFGAFLGTRFLAEGQAQRRLIAAGCMVAGILLLATA